jgi:hypothetical protein
MTRAELTELIVAGKLATHNVEAALAQIRSIPRPAHVPARRWRRVIAEMANMVVEAKSIIADLETMRSRQP